MIYITFHISWPMRHRRELKGKYWDWKVSKNKSISLQLEKSQISFDIIGFTFNLTARQSHAGLMVDFSLLGHTMIFEFSDNRHWDRENDRWEETE